MHRRLLLLGVLALSAASTRAGQAVTAPGAPPTVTVSPTNKSPIVTPLNPKPKKPVSPPDKKGAPPVTNAATLPTGDAEEDNKKQLELADQLRMWLDIEAYRLLTQFKTTDADEPIMWISGVKRVFAAAEKKQQPFIVYIADEAHYALAGEGDAYWGDWKKEHSGVTPEKTVFECAEVRKAFAAGGINIACKVQSTPADLDALQASGLGANTLLVYAPDGERLAKFSGEECQPRTVCQFFQNEFAEKLDAWRVKQSFLRPGATPGPSDASLVNTERKQP